MLNIDKAQMNRLGAYTRERFVIGMVAHLRRTFPERSEGFSDARMSELVKGGILLAEDHEVVYEDDIRRYLEYLVIYGAPLGGQPQTGWIAAILQREDIDGSEKLALIDARELELLRSQA